MQAFPFHLSLAGGVFRWNTIGFNKYHLTYVLHYKGQIVTVKSPYKQIVIMQQWDFA